MDEVRDAQSHHRDFINLEHDFEREGWAAALGVSVAELVAAVKVVGNAVPAVCEYLGKPDGSATIF